MWVVRPWRRPDTQVNSAIDCGRATGNPEVISQDSNSGLATIRPEVRLPFFDSIDLRESAAACCFLAVHNFRERTRVGCDGFGDNHLARHLDVTVKKRPAAQNVFESVQPDEIGQRVRRVGDNQNDRFRCKLAPFLRSRIAAAAVAPWSGTSWR